MMTPYEATILRSRLMLDDIWAESDKTKHELMHPLVKMAYKAELAEFQRLTAATEQGTLNPGD